VPVGDANAMAEAINRLIENPEFAKTLGENAAKIGEKANSETIFREWESYLDELC
jgi:glycosyltransferase involved in cell wall biosynthesis